MCEIVSDADDDSFSCPEKEDLDLLPSASTSCFAATDTYYYISRPRSSAAERKPREKVSFPLIKMMLLLY